MKRVLKNAQDENQTEDTGPNLEYDNNKIRCRNEHKIICEKKCMRKK